MSENNMYPPVNPPMNPAPMYGGGPVKPDNYLVWAILTTVLCCLPFGIVSIVFSAKVDGLWAQGQWAAAQDASEKAKKWAIVSAVVGGVAVAVWLVTYFIFFVAVLGTAGMSSVSP